VRVRQICAIILMLGSGCARGMSLSQAAARLEADTRGVLAQGARQLGAPGARSRIVLDARHPCRGGRARQVLRGILPLRRGPDPGVDLDQATDVTIGLARDRGYRLEYPPALANRFRTFALTRDGSVGRMIVQLHGGPHPSLRLDASTPCLPGA
jgi:hypothetical protein